MKLTLVPPDAPILRQKAKKTRPAAVAELARQLIETMVAEGGVGLAAPQVGQGIRVFVTGVDKQYRVFINPELSNFSTEKIWWEEGCLSLPRLLGEVERPKQVTVTATDEQGRKVRFAADGLMARVLQHEVDHLDGILFPDRMADLSKLKRLTEEEWESRYNGQTGDE